MSDVWEFWRFIIWFVCTLQKIPYMGPIYGGLKDGMSVNIRGTAHEDMDRWGQECSLVEGDIATSPEGISEISLNSSQISLVVLWSTCALPSRSPATSLFTSTLALLGGTRWSSTPLRTTPGAQRRRFGPCPSPKASPSKLSSWWPQRAIRSGSEH